MLALAILRCCSTGVTSARAERRMPLKYWLEGVGNLYCIVFDELLSVISGAVSAAGAASTGVAGVAAAAEAKPSGSALTLEASSPVTSDILSRLGAVQKTN
jgi:hypothetical protein